ncbi:MULTISPECIES: hypothetical protein [unclassified Thiocapsa]|uniref:hypothetical protein n=1 Tax=unclassified Thiocapsa TaxID=2641286 RepID=UPI0035B220F0
MNALSALALFIVAGPVLVAYMVYPYYRRSEIFGFVVLSVVGMGIVGVIGQGWLFFLFIAWQWWFALRPIFEKLKSNRK